MLNSSGEKTEREIKETIPFTIVTKRIQYLGKNQTKETKDLYVENYKTLMKEIKNDTNIWITLGSILIFTILILLIHENGIFLHLLVSSLISFTSVL